MKKILITGSEGFIGTVARNLLSSRGYEVYGLDNLSRCFKSHDQIKKDGLFIADIRDTSVYDRLPKVDVILHLAAQVSVVGGNLYPELDFDTNARGTFNVVQWAKKIDSQIIYASTNKVFGDLIGAKEPIKDSQPLAPKTNYGVSKCTGTMYVDDFGGHILHQSCIYGETQLGDINQGWVGWLRQCRTKNIPITCFGDGTQVRDLLHVSDLVDLYEKCISGIVPKGQYIAGGGIENAFSFSQVVSMFNMTINKYDTWRDHDQRYFVSDNTKLRENNYWMPKVKFEDFVQKELV